MEKKQPKYQHYYKGQYLNTQQLNEILEKEQREKRDKATQGQKRARGLTKCNA